MNQKKSNLLGLVAIACSFVIGFFFLRCGARCVTVKKEPKKIEALSAHETLAYYKNKWAKYMMWHNRRPVHLPHNSSHRKEVRKLRWKIALLEALLSKSTQEK